MKSKTSHLEKQLIVATWRAMDEEDLSPEQLMQRVIESLNGVLKHPIDEGDVAEALVSSEGNGNE